jgi:hypothetical protein
VTLTSSWSTAEIALGEECLDWDPVAAASPTHPADLVGVCPLSITESSTLTKIWLDGVITILNESG